MLRDRAKRKAKSRVKSKARSKVKGAVRDDDGPKVLKAAAVGGTAYYAGKKIQEKRQEEAGVPEAPLTTTPEKPAADAGTDTVAQLQQVAQMHDSGILTDAEFASAKQRILEGG